MKKPEWIVVAEREVGVKRFSQGSSNPRITEYHQGTNIAGYDDKAAWCSSFLDWVFREVGFKGTGSALARSWLEWGAHLLEPRLGCVVVLERENPNGWQGHVGLFIKIENDRIYLLGGNQLNEVREHYYPLTSVLDSRWPT
jgi:uncharacterized protein (TIGR02594 family)